jgi:DNA repair protein RadB
MELAKEGLNIIYGAEATGKTTFALMEVCEFLKKGKKIVFMDTENSFSVERLNQIFGSHFNKKLLDNLFLINVNNFSNQTKSLKQVEMLESIDLVIVDSIGRHYRNELKADLKKVNNEMSLQLNILKAINCKGTLILLTNQVYTQLNTNKIEIVGGNMMRNWSTMLIELSKNEDKRTMKILKPTQEEYRFEIVNEGIKLILE